ncbi:chromophore lyase CpcT/CpeT [Lusitaniella coriacea LEGE 07157]|uniref:Chromophore lyase CpcT/CpeT n=1 Tax=Lusitaniella coriacea LEGE 07157 TaxID=945747 RepID=A0A8J7DZ93_9CYAN|nr:chromophore lyase CpcT/CpeT [Lusitaniella coriacea]MBE9117781.1 chromophore lyase CpcT/CpeT [Lusitaniella coriacea LEGE 07157]
MKPELIALGQYLAGQFDNREQALAEPAWYVHLHLWKRPVPLFLDDSITLFAEQANIVNLNQPYRPRLLRLRENPRNAATLQVEYYMFKNIEVVRGAGQDPSALQHLTPEEVEFLPGCTLEIQVEKISTAQYRFRTNHSPDSRCSFTYQGNQYQVSLGFEVTPDELLVYDRGIDPTTGKAIWGALLGPFRFTKRQDFSNELFVKSF